MSNLQRGYIIATDQDGLNAKSYIFEFVLDISRIKNTSDMRQAITDAVKEFCQTEEGRKIYEGNCNNFNWGDLEAYVPEAILNRYGLYKPVEHANTILEVDFNEQLINENDVFEKN